ncbi:MAG TPA: hypothetical protein VG963_20790 [Polyangiaceae bacterium]|nr:hypothetical protein [Polyangiaceae bacterium]
MLRDTLVRHSRPALALCSGIGAYVFAWAAWTLPSQPGTVLGLIAGLLSAAHGLLLLAAVFAPKRMPGILGPVGVCSLVAGATFAGAILWTAIEMVRHFGSLGWGVSALLGAIGVLSLALTWPFGIWALLLVRRARGSG